MIPIRWLLLFFLGLPIMSTAQEAAVATVKAIIIEGNVKTRDAVIFRELDFQIGTKIPISSLQDRLEINRLNVQNTGLFIKTNLNVLDWDTEVQSLIIGITVKEAWYLYPYIIFSLADRNFNVWWDEQNRSLKRVNFGISLNHFNLTGRRDRLKLTVQDGYTKKYELDYNLPGINPDQTVGLFGNIYFARRKELAYITQENKLLFDQFNDQFQLRRFRMSGGISYRPGIYHYHTFKLQWSDNGIAERIGLELNPDYFLAQRTRQRHLTFYYEYTIDKRDLKPYPLNGFLFSATFQKDGFGLTGDVNALPLTVAYTQYFSWWKKWSVELFLKGKYQVLRDKLPYTHVSDFGYGSDFARGYELYVVDGMDFALFKSTLRYELWNKEYNLGKYIPIEQFKLLPIRVYLTLNNDAAYVNTLYYNQYGNLNNIPLWGGGIGLDVVVYNDKVMRFQYSFNHLGEKGLFLHFKLTP